MPSIIKIMDSSAAIVYNIMTKANSVELSPELCFFNVMSLLTAVDCRYNMKVITFNSIVL